MIELRIISLEENPKIRQLQYRWFDATTRKGWSEWHSVPIIIMDQVEFEKQGINNERKS